MGGMRSSPIYAAALAGSRVAAGVSRGVVLFFDILEPLCAARPPS